MATFCALIRPTEQKKDGTWNVKIRLTHKRAVKYIATPFFVTKKQLTKSFKIKDATILDKVNEKIKEYRDKILLYGFAIDNMDADSIVSILSKQTEHVDFIEYCKKHIDKLKADGRLKTAQAYSGGVNSLLKFNQGKPLYFENITAKYMYDYYQSLSYLKANTKRSYIWALETIYKKAQLELNDDDAGIIVAKNGVFRMIELPNSEMRNDNAFSVEQMQAIINLPYTGNFAQDLMHDLFIFSFACMGINPVDIFSMKKSQCANGVITYRRSKVSRKLGADADMCVKVNNVLEHIIAKYNGNAEFLIDTKTYARNCISNLTNRIHSTFIRAGVETEETKGKYVFYTARHTMASLARNECGIDYMTIHEMLNHSTPVSFKTTDVYIKRDFSRLWDANEKLLSLFDWSFYLNQ